ncbi:MAG TPA: cytochrome P450 [Gemmatimonadaceae bacterium]|jgi:cytochrome P450|nr:cytochrome P450 [Gemmatimonadaceae bacterium]
MSPALTPTLARLPQFAPGRSKNGFPPGPKPRYPFQFVLQVARNPLGLMIAMARDYGDIAHYKIGPQHLFFINDPELIRDVLVTNQKNFHKSRGLERAKRLLGNGLLTSEGEFHLRQRRLAQPAFHRQRIAAYGSTMVEFAERARTRWKDGATLDMHTEMMRLTLDIVAKTLFDADVDAEAAEIGKAMTTAFESFNYAMIPFTEYLDHVPIPPVRRFNSARDRLDKTIFRLIAERRASGEDRGDLLSMLLLAQDTEGDGTGMSDAQLRDEALTIFLAGHETTANALTWTWYLLSQHPEVEKRFHAEIDSLNGVSPTIDDLARLPYTRMVLAESMRLYPPAWAIGRRALDAFQMREFNVPAGAVVLMSQYVMHRDGRYFPDPERFDPERWTPEAQAARPKFSYFPFGGGARVCIGEQFAWMEGILLLATIAQKWKMRLVPDQIVDVQPLITLRPRFGMRMEFQSRI